MILAVNKWDQIENKDFERQIIEQKLQADFGFAWWAPLVFISAKTGLNTPKLLELAEHIRTARTHTHQAAELDAIITKAVAHHPPALVDNRRPRFTSIRQTNLKPPQFTIVGHRLGGLHWSYRRYLETQLRQQLDLMGTTVELRFETKRSRA